MSHAPPSVPATQRTLCPPAGDGITGVDPRPAGNGPPQSVSCCPQHLRLSFAPEQDGKRCLVPPLPSLPAADSTVTLRHLKGKKPGWNGLVPPKKEPSGAGRLPVPTRAMSRQGR